MHMHIFLDVCGTKILVKNEITVIIYIIGYSSTAMERTCKRAEYDICFAPPHRIELLSAHQSHFCLRVIAEDQGFQSDVSDIQRKCDQICQAELR